LRGGSFIKLGYNVWELEDAGDTGGGTISAARLEYGWNF